MERMKRDKPKECVNTGCRNIIYTPYYLMHSLLECDECRLMRQSELYGDIKS